jgi:hypothetical protein
MDHGVMGPVRMTHRASGGRTAPSRNSLGNAQPLHSGRGRSNPGSQVPIPSPAECSPFHLLPPSQTISWLYPCPAGSAAACEETDRSSNGVLWETGVA